MYAVYHLKASCFVCKYKYKNFSYLNIIWDKWIQYNCIWFLHTSSGNLPDFYYPLYFSQKSLHLVQVQGTSVTGRWAAEVPGGLQLWMMNHILHDILKKFWLFNFFKHKSLKYSSMLCDISMFSWLIYQIFVLKVKICASKLLYKTQTQAFFCFSHIKYLYLKYKYSPGQINVYY